MKKLLFRIKWTIKRKALALKYVALAARMSVYERFPFYEYWTAEQKLEYLELAEEMARLDIELMECFYMLGDEAGMKVLTANDKLCNETIWNLKRSLA